MHFEGWVRGPAASRSMSWSFSSAEALRMRDHWVNALLVFITPQCNNPDYTLKAKSFYSVWLELLFTSKCYALISSYSPPYGYYYTFINLVITIIWIFLEVLDINTIQGQFMHCWKWEDSTRRVKCFLYEVYHLVHVVCSHIAGSGLVQLLHEFLINNVMISLLVLCSNFIKNV